MSILDHVGVRISDMDKSRAFYNAALGALGIEKVSDFAYDGKTYCGYGKGSPDFWIDNAKPAVGAAHIAFVAASHAEVDAFYKAALAAGGKDNGGPGIRKEYSENYYAAFVFDPDGHNVEAVCHGTK